MIKPTKDFTPLMLCCMRVFIYLNADYVRVGDWSRFRLFASL